MGQASSFALRHGGVKNLDHLDHFFKKLHYYAIVLLVEQAVWLKSPDSPCPSDTWQTTPQKMPSLVDGVLLHASMHLDFPKEANPRPLYAPVQFHGSFLHYHSTRKRIDTHPEE
jgi:hypothetical protein